MSEAAIKSIEMLAQDVVAAAPCAKRRCLEGNDLPESIKRV
jgi:hypothetical protein